MADNLLPNGRYCGIFGPMDAITAKPRARATKKLTIRSLLGVNAADNLKLAQKVEAGLSYDSFERVGKVSGLSLDDLRTAVRIAPRTLTRRRQENKLSPEESDRLVSLSRLLSLTFELFGGDAHAGLRWFTSKNRALGGIAPLEAAATETGSREVENLIGRLEHGVFT